MDDDVAAWVEVYAASKYTEPELSALTARVNATIEAQVPEMVSDAAVRADLEASTRANMYTYFTGVGARAAPIDIKAPDAARDLGRSLAQRNLDADVLLAVYRQGVHALWRDVMRDVGRAELDDDLRMRILDFLWDHLSRVIEFVLEDLVREHADQLARQAHGAFAQRIETIQSILRGDDVDTASATRVLGHHLLHHQLALALWSDRRERSDVEKDLSDLARRLAAAVDAPPPLTMPCGPAALWAWIATPAEPDLVLLAKAVEEDTGLLVAAGHPIPGVAGFRESHSEALRAQDIAERSGTGRHLTLFRDVELISLLSSDTEAMRALVRRELGALAARDESAERLRRTALAYLEAGSAARAADILAMHKNTILYRIQQIEELLEHPIEERRLEVEVALRVVEMYGAAALPSD